jgi:hypothetical protein
VPVLRRQDHGKGETWNERQSDDRPAHLPQHEVIMVAGGAPVKPGRRGSAPAGFRDHLDPGHLQPWSTC